jgi:hypothetical protein
MHLKKKMFLRRSPMRKRRCASKPNIPSKKSIESALDGPEFEKLVVQWIDALGFNAENLHEKYPSSWSKFTSVTLLHEAAQQGSARLCQWLWDRGFRDINNRDNNKRATPLFWAAGKGHLEVLKWLVSHGGHDNVRTPNNLGWTPLLFASWQGHLKVVEVRNQEAQ